jgi:outer membrane receptor for ferrienterochelin and colicins
MKLKILIVALYAIAMSINVWGQEIQGVVYENAGGDQKPTLPGVNIYWAGTTEGTVSGLDGSFKIKQANKQNPWLVFSFVGFGKDTVDISDHDSKHMLEVSLSFNQTLKEVEIIAIKRGSVISRLDPIFTQNLNQNELAKAACCNLSESFETNASVDVSYSDAVTGAKQIKLLGLAGTYSQMLAENIPNIRGLATTYGLEYIPGSWMESIQISKGTSSVKNGYESVTGQINVEYKKPDNSDKFFLNMYGNDKGKIEGNFNTSLRLNSKWSSMLFGHFEDLSNNIDDNDDSFLDVPKVRQYHFFNRWKYFNPEKLVAQFGVKILDEKRIGGQTTFDKNMPRDTNNAYGIEIDTRRYELFTKTGIFLSRPNTSFGIINSFVFHDQKSFFGLTNYNAREYNYYGNFMYQTYLFNSQHSYTLGLSYMYDSYDENLNDSLFSRTESVPGVFLEYTFSLDEKLSILAGLRSDFHNLYGTLITPRFHIRYAPTKNWILRASTGKAYRNPNIIAENSYILASSKKLRIHEEPKIEEAWNYGVNITKYTQIAGRQLILNAEFYRTDFINQLVVDMDQDIFEVNIYNLHGKSFSNSFQIEANYELFKRFELTAAYRYNDVQITLNDKLQQKPMVNRYKALLSMTYSTKNSGWQFDFTAQLNGDARLPGTDQYPEQYQRAEKSSQYSIFNAQITKQIKDWALYLGGENLGGFKQDNPIIAADKPFGKYFDTSMVWGPIMGRKIYFGFRYSIPNK